MNSLFPILAIVRKDISVWLRQPTSIAATVLPAIAFMVILYFGAQAVRRKPVALVVQDSGPHAQELVNILSDSGAFKVGMITITPQKAEDALKQVKVPAVITIPSNFDAAYNAQKPDPVTIHINNLNLDLQNDLHLPWPPVVPDSHPERGKV